MELVEVLKNNSSKIALFPKHSGVLGTFADTHLASSTCLARTCSFVLSATSQQYFSLRTNKPPAISHQYFFLKTNQHQPSAISQTNIYIDGVELESTRPAGIEVIL
jgi:hypothetical protein